MSGQRHLVGLAALGFVVFLTNSAWAVTANPLENAYWRFEEGTNDLQVDSTASDPVKDSINANHLNAATVDSSPVYTNAVPPTPLKSGLANNLAMNFDANDDLYTLNADGTQGTGKHISNGMVGPPVAPAITGFTIEAAFKPNSVDSLYHAILSKEGQPVSGNNVETLELKVRGDNHKLQIEQFDGAANQVQVSSINTINSGQWYYAAVVDTGTTLSLYLNSNDGNGYQLQGSTALAGGAIYQGPSNNDWNHSWTVGRGNYAGNAADWFNGLIDEVRITNSALQPWQFLFAPQGDYNGDNVVNAADYAVWRKTNVYGAQGYTLWRNNYGNVYGGSGLSAASVPEPATVVLASLSIVGLAVGMRRSARPRQT